MAIIKIETTTEEQEAVMDVLRLLEGQTVPVAKISSMANLNPNRVRYIIADLLEAGKIKRVTSKAYNKHYVRYRYEVTEQPDLSATQPPH